MLLVGSHLFRRNPDVFTVELDKDSKNNVARLVDSSFWEHAESAYIRIASYWDRVGQLLDFAFFSIRQFERDGFTAVVDRIRTNFIPMDASLSTLDARVRVRAFQTSEKVDGLKWLLRRRNLVVHSLYLRPLNENGEGGEHGAETLFDSEFNHLDASLRRKLAPGSPAEEIERLNAQLQKAAELFPAMLALCEYAAAQRSSWGRS
jgi:hypothetical protein